MKKVILMILIAFLLSISNSFCYAQKPRSTVADLLKNKTWEKRHLSASVDCVFTQMYGENSVYSVLNCKGEKESGIENLYYLSDVIDQCFMKEKMGLFPNGKYIIVQTKYKVSTYEIIKINADSLVTKFCLHPGDTIIGAPTAIVYTVQKKKRK